MIEAILTYYYNLIEELKQLASRLQKGIGFVSGRELRAAA